MANLISSPSMSNQPSKEPFVRVHQPLPDGKTCVQLPVMQGVTTGQRVMKPVTNTKPIPLRVVQERGCIIDSSLIQSSMQQNNLPFGVGYAETAQGQGLTYRSEAAGQILERQQLYISISNGEATTEEFIVGDGVGLLATKFGIGAPKAGVVIGGSFGTATYTTINAICASVPLDLHRIHLQGKTTAGADSDAVFNTGFIKMSKASVVNNSAIDEEFPVRDLVLQNSFQTNIRVNDEWRFLMGPLTGIHLSIPAGEQLIMTFREVSAIGDVWNMRKYSPTW